MDAIIAFHAARLPLRSVAHIDAAMTDLQSFEDVTDRAASGPRMARLRAELAARGPHAFYAAGPLGDLNKYFPPSGRRLAPHAEVARTRLAAAVSDSPVDKS